MKSLLSSLLLLFALPARAADLWELRVHLLSDDERAELRRFPGDTVLCRAPCDAPLRFATADDFYVGGSGIVQSSRFQLPPRNGDLTLRVSPARTSSRYLGTGLVVLGGATAIVAGGFALSQSCIEVSAGSPCPARSQTPLIVGAVGIVVAIIGTVVRLANSATEVTIEP